MTRRTVLRSVGTAVLLPAALLGAVLVPTVLDQSPVEARPCVFHDIPSRRCPRPPRTPVTAPPTSAATTTTTPPGTVPTTTAAPTTTVRPGTVPPTIAPPGGPGPVVPGAQFTATFDTPEDFFNRFQTQVFFGINQDTSTHHRWLGDHNMGCAGPTTYREVNHNSHADDPNLFWWCAPNGPATGHVMTSLLTGGYGQADFAPNRAFNNVRRVCWDQSMVGLPRKWTQVIIVPEGLYQSNGGKLNYANPELQPFPAGDALPAGPLPVGANGPEFPGRDAFNASWAPQWDGYVLAFTVGSLQQYSRGGAQYYFNAIETGDPAPRFRQCLEDLENGQIRHTNTLGNGQTRTVTLAGSLPNGPARVIFQDDTYDAFKADNPDPTGLSGGAVESTWHWDNITID
jgi:hypothetical protein